MTPTVRLDEIVGYLDGILRVRDIPDHPNALNGLQVSNTGTIGRIVAAVDASQAAIDFCRASGPAEGHQGTLLVTHHGLFWDGNVPVTRRRYRRLKALFDGDIALYAAHIPLDVHPEVGNNAVLLQRLGMDVRGWWGEHRGIKIGTWGTLSEPRENLRHRLEGLLHAPARLIPGGPEQAARVGVITGAGGSAISEAIAAGLDTLITGEGPHHTFFDAMEGGINVIYAGHYATETVGVQAVAAGLSSKYGLPWAFFRQDTGM